jgi:Winged helix-turn helix
MGKIRPFPLSAADTAALIHLRDHAPKAYVRERGAALLKVAGGQPAAAVARSGLLRPRAADTVYAWLNRFAAEGVAGLTVKPGRGRKPAFSPCAPGRCDGARRAAPRGPARAPRVRRVEDPLDAGGPTRGV